MNTLCDYGCNQHALFRNKSGKNTCTKHFSGCPVMKEKMSSRIRQTYINGRPASKTSIKPWNKGLTAENDIRILKGSEKRKVNIQLGLYTPVGT